MKSARRPLQERVTAKRGATAFPPGEGSWIYFAAEHNGNIKIGWAKHVPSRMAELQIGNSREIWLLAWMAGDRNLEKALHKALTRYRLRGEWFARNEFLFELATTVHGMTEIDWDRLCRAVWQCAGLTPARKHVFPLAMTAGWEPTPDIC